MAIQPVDSSLSAAIWSLVWFRRSSLFPSWNLEKSLGSFEWQRYVGQICTQSVAEEKKQFLGLFSYFGPLFHWFLMFKFLFKDGGLLGGGVGEGGGVGMGMFLLCSYYVFHRLVNLFTVRFLCVIVRPWDCPLNCESHGKTVRLERSVTGPPSVGCFLWCQHFKFWSKRKCRNTWMFVSMDKTMLFLFQWSQTGCLI